MKLSKHAKERLWHRFKIKKGEFRKIANLFETSYILIDIKNIKNEFIEIREIDYNNKKIQAIITGERIKTVIPCTIIQDDECEQLDIIETLIDRIVKLESINKRKEKIINLPILKIMGIRFKKKLLSYK